MSLSLDRREFLDLLGRTTAGVAIAGGLASLLPGTPLLAQGKPALPDLGVNVSLKGRRFFPDDNPWNQDISKAAIDPNSAKYVDSVGLGKNLHPDFGTVYNGAPSGIQYVVVPGNQPKIPVEFEYGDESDPGPYPIPPNPPIEGGPKSEGDRHILMLDRDNWKLYELFSCYPLDGGRKWKAGSGAIFDLNSNKLRPEGWTSADAAGLPILPGLVRYDEVVEAGVIPHALRFTVRKTQRGYVHPATHWASRSKDPNLPPMGMRVRLKAGYDISKFPKPVQVILTCLKTYGMLLADNGGDWFISGSPNPKWDDDALSTIKRVKGRDLEVVRIEKLVTG